MRGDRTLFSIFAANNDSLSAHNKCSISTVKGTDATNF